jgi:N-acetyl-alpha-D-muramate 1-phosphate uridylyltransferase
MLPVVVLAGGRGTRVAALTGEAFPKAMIDVAGRPFIDVKLGELWSKGVEEVYLLVGHASAPLEEHMRTRGAQEHRVTVIHDGPTLLGTGGAIVRARGELPPEFWVTYGDSLLDAPMEPIEAVWRSTYADGLLVVLHNRDRWQPSNTTVADNRVTSYSKGAPPGRHEYIDYGLSIFRSEAFGRYREGEPLDLGQVLNDLILAGRLDAYVTEGARFDDVGTPEAWRETNARWGRPDLSGQRF